MTVNRPKKRQFFWNYFHVFDWVSRFNVNFMRLSIRYENPKKKSNKQQLSMEITWVSLMRIRSAWRSESVTKGENHAVFCCRSALWIIVLYRQFDAESFSVKNKDFQNQQSMGWLELDKPQAWKNALSEIMDRWRHQSSSIIQFALRSDESAAWMSFELAAICLQQH